MQPGTLDSPTLVSNVKRPKSDVPNVDALSRRTPLAVDVGGSFSKMVYWRPPNPPDMPSYVIKEFQGEGSSVPLKPDPSLNLEMSSKGCLKFLKFPSSRTVDFIQFVMDNNLHQQYGPDKMKVINGTGGGAFKYASVVQEKLGIVVSQHDEMRCLIKGLNFLLQHADNEAFCYSAQDNQRHSVPIEDDFPFPYLLVNIGSGVSILKVDDDDKFERVSGSSLGGGTFWGLCKMLTDIQSFDDVKELSQRGDNKHVDLLVGDIYGGDYDTLGLKADVIASSFGKVATHREDLKQESGVFKKEDIVRSLLFMISNNIAQIGYLNAKQHGAKRIFFSGGFLQGSDYILGRLDFAVNFWSKGEMRAHFLRHNSYLGALGAWLME
eukprot:TRINITY_DN3302_c0_g1_i3.p1 TRINITY_DN3302_c0_g1~~TRINITY_DN3302_c0_g1_i3.p1  ORF type:complete len:379 (+),score=101.98 TRINITY_DN3302_c0_g1_i3:106-1242(+)